jgi:hypothetical protein
MKRGQSRRLGTSAWVTGIDCISTVITMELLVSLTRTDAVADAHSTGLIIVIPVDARLSCCLTARPWPAMRVP